MGRKVTVRELVDVIELQVLAGENGLEHVISEVDITFPWLEFAGVLNYFESTKINLHLENKSNNRIIERRT